MIFYTHIGGFVSGSSTSIGKYLLQLFLELEHSGLVCDILSVDYDLSPAEVYPTALQQVIRAYENATSLGKPMILMGDSAGGNLCLGLLQHLVLPNPLIEAQSEKMTNSWVAAACLLSPWVNIRTEGSSLAKYRHMDCLDKTALDSWADHYLGPSGKVECYNSPIERKTKWRTILPKRTAFLAGDMELFKSDILDFAHGICKGGVFVSVIGIG